MAEPNAAPGVKARVVGTTDVGRVREHNEDSFLVMDRDAGRALAPGEVLDGDVRSALFLLVCDGMGGAAAGEVASRMAAQRVSEVLAKADFSAASPDQIASLMDQAVQQANTEIFEKARGNSEMKGMGTTLTAAVVAQGRLFVSQVGDSRAYLLRKGLLNQITKDQSLIGQLIEEGTLTEEEAEKLGGRNIVLQAVGVEETLRVDTKHWPLLRGDVVLLCSDGLSGMVKDARMREVLNEKGEDLRAAADQLIADANAGGGRDNITVVLGRFDGEALRPPMETEGGAMEAAGASFKAPPPPDVPNPMKKVAAWGGVLLVAITAAFLAFRPTKAHLSFPVKPAGAKVVLADRDGREVATVTAGADPVRIEDLEPGDYRLQVTAPKHFDATQDLPITEQGNVELPEIWLVPKPGTLTVRAQDADVSVRVTLKPDHPKGTPIDGETFRLPEPGQPRTTGNVSVGAWTIEASRPGFRAKTIEGHVDPEEAEDVTVPRLDEVTGTLVIEGASGGKVEVRTASGEPLFSGSTGGDRMTAPVRAVKVRVRVEWPGYRPFEAEADVKEGASTTVVAKREADRVRVTVQGPPKRVVQIERSENGRWTQVSEVVVEAGGSAPPVNLVPGRYRVRFDDGSGAVEFELKAGAGETTVGVGK